MPQRTTQARRAVDIPELCSDIASHVVQYPAAYLGQLRKGPAGWIDDRYLPEFAAGFVGAIGHSEKYYVTASMNEVVRTAAESLTDAPIALHDFPSPVGFMYLCDGWRESCFGPSALLWLWSGGKLRVIVFETPHTVSDTVIAKLGTRPHLAPSSTFEVPVSETFRLNYRRGTTEEVTSVLLTACYLLRQKIAVLAPAAQTRAEARKLRRHLVDPMAVRVIAMRSRGGGSAEKGSGDHEWHHQWFVRGHWRKQWYATDQVNRPIWIAPYIKGPEGAPMLGTEKVYALQR